MDEKLFFFYGTLRDPLIFQKVLGDPRAQTLFEQGRKAILKGYELKRVEGQDFPGLSVYEAGQVEGILVPLTTPLVEKLIQYEDPDDYEVREFPGEANAYYFHNLPSLTLSLDTWNFEEFFLSEARQKVLAKIDYWMS